MSSEDTSKGTEEVPQCVKKVSRWEKASTLATCAQALVVLISLWYISEQMQQQTLLAQAANTKSLADTSIQLTYTVAQNENLARLQLKDAEGYEENGDKNFKDETEGFQFRNFIIAQMIFYENIYYQNKQGLLDKEVFSEWEQDLDAFIESHPYMKVYWSKSRCLYYEELRKHVDKVIDRQQMPEQPCQPRVNNL
jgi:hypothetical protein